MKQGSSWCHRIFVVIAVLICLFPTYGAFIDQNTQLQGVSSTEGKLLMDFDSIWSGRMYDSIESDMQEKIPGRTSLIRLHNQMMYSLFNSSSNTNVVIGSKHSLFEPEYLCDYLNLWPEMSEDALNELADKLNNLQSLLARTGKKLYIFITPSKARFDYPNIPLAYRVLSNPKTHTNYDLFTSKLDATSISYFDSIEYINKHMNDSTIFYSTGTHWSNGAAAQITAAMLEDLKRETGYDLGSLSIDLVDSEEGMVPDQDLLSTLNLYSYIKEDDYRIPEYHYTPGTDHPNVLIRGGSFMGQSLGKLIEQDVFGESIYIENNYVITDKTDVRFLTDFNIYDGIDLAELAKMANIVILEVNEEKIWIMGWGIIDELINALQRDDNTMNIRLIGEDYQTAVDNPWDKNVGFILYNGRRGVLLASPLHTGVIVEAQNNGNTLSFDAEIHDVVRQYSDGCSLLVKLEGVETEEYEYLIPGGSEEDAVIHVTIPIEGVRQVSISYYCPEGTTQDCDWLVISDINVD